MAIQDSGYLIVMRAEAMLRAYSQGRIAREYPELLQQLREATSFLDPTAYRGMAGGRSIPFLHSIPQPSMRSAGAASTWTPIRRRGSGSASS